MTADPVRLPIRLGVSSCLLGRPVRYDGGHKRHDFLVDRLGRFVEWWVVCPEVEIGLGTPRPPIRLERRGDAVRQIMADTGSDLTNEMRRYAAERVQELSIAGLSGYVLKSRSPSCGLRNVEVVGAAPGAHRGGRGLFAEALLAGIPHLPIEEEARIDDPRLRESFISAVFARRRWLEVVAWGADGGSLRRFHGRHEMLLDSREAGAAARLGRILEGTLGPGTADRYAAGFFEVMRRVPTPEDHARVLRDALRRMSVVGAAAAAELAERIRAYLAGAEPLSGLVERLARLTGASGHESLGHQLYLRPHPRELRLLDRL